jgi:hypothetical protein
MLASLRAEAIKLRRLWLPAIAVGSGLVLFLLLWLSLSMAGARLESEQNLEVPWQAGAIGDAMVSMTLVLPTLVVLLTALCFFVEHKGEMWKQLRATPQPLLSIYAAKFVAIQLLIATAIVTALIASVIAWPTLPEVLQREMAASAAAARSELLLLALMLHLSLLPVAIVQFALSARLPNILHPVGIGLAATFASLMAFGPTNGQWLPYAYPGAVIMARFATPPAAPPDQQTDVAYRAPANALSGAPAGGGAILVDGGHGNRHGLGTSDAPGTLHWLRAPAEAAGVPLRSAPAITSETLARARLLILAGASRPLAPQEVDSVVAWVRNGGSLILLTDQEPFASPTAELAQRFGVRFSLRMVTPPGEAGLARLRFSRAERSLGEHPATSGADQVVTYGGQAVWRLDADTARLLLLSEAAAGPDAAQLIAFPFGNGRVVVSGETGLFTAQRHGDGAPIGVADMATGNERLAVNVLRWLLRAEPL